MMGQGVVVGGRPVREQLEAVVAGGAWDGCLGDEQESFVRAELHGIRGEVHVAHDRVPDLLVAGPVLSDGVAGPQRPELGAGNGELPTRFVSDRSEGVQPAAVRRRATLCYATASRSR
jgi:hypothetical protein